MRKLKIALIMLFAATLSLFLFACQKKTSAKIDDITASGSLTLTDADDEGSALSKLQQLTFTAVYDNPKVEDRVIPAGEYTVSWTGVTFGKVGSYTASVTTEKDNEYGVAATVAVTIGHNFGAADSEGVQTCSVCNAVQIEQTIADTFKIEGWNDGVVLGAENKYIKSDPRLFSDDKPVTSVVGRLDKGMTIKLIGKGKALKTANTYYYPILGVANIEENGSVIQRNDNWSIYGAMRGKLNAWAGNPYSDMDATAGWVGAEAADALRVYVDGPVSAATDYYVNDGADYVAVELTWSYSEDGVVTMTWYNPTLDGTGRTRTATIKMPDRQYYNAILHGEFFEFVAEKVQIVQTLKLKSVDKIVVKENSVIENKYFDYNNMDVDITYEGNKKAKADAGVMEVYANKGTITELPADNVEKGGRTYGEWVDLATTKMSKEFHSYKLRVQIGNDWIEKIIPATEAAKIKVVANAVDHANSNVVTANEVKFEDTGLNAIAFTETADHKAGLTVSGKVASLSAAQKTALGTEKTHYVAFSVYADGATKFGGTATVEGTEGKVNVTESKLDVVLAVNADTETATIKGVNGGTDIVVTIEELIGATVTSTLSANTLKLDESKDITVTYQLADLGNIQKHSFLVGSEQVFIKEVDGGYAFRQTTAGGLTLNGITVDETAKTLTVSLTVPAADLANPSNYTIALVDQGGVRLVTDTIRYEMAFTENATMAGEYYAKVSGTTLYLAKAFATTNVTTENKGANLNLMANAGANTAADYKQYKFLQNHDLAYAVANDGSVTFTSSTLLANLASAKFVAFGSINNAEDTDNGALLVVSINLSTLGIQANTAFAFAVDSTKEGNLSYKPVSAQGEIGADVEYTLPANPIKLKQAASCLESTDTVYEVGGTGNNAVFYAFASSVYDVAHQWATTADENGRYLCSVCGGVRNYVAGGADVAAEKYMTGALGEITGLTASFEVRMATGDWAAQALVTGAGNVIITLPNLDPWNNSVNEALLDATDREKALATKLKGTNLFPTANNTSYLLNEGAWDSFLNNYYYVTISVSKTEGIQYYRNGVLLVSYPASAAMGSSNVGEFAELFLSIASRHGVMLNASGAPMVNVTVTKGAVDAGVAKTNYDEYVEANGVPEMPKTVKKLDAKEIADTPATEEVTVGAADCSVGYSVGKTWLMKKGQKLVITGQLTVVAAKQDNWNGIGMIFDRVDWEEGNDIPTNGRIDNWVNGGVTVWNIVAAPAATDETGAPIEDWVAEMKALRAAANTTTYTFDWTDPTRLVCELKIVGTNGHTFTQTYTITAKAGFVWEGTTDAYDLDDWALVGLAVDSGYFTGNTAWTYTA